MKPFLDRDFLLDSKAARRLYHDYAKNQPIVDYHCHLSAKELAEDRHWDDLTRLWLGEDHYKWRAMRFDGIGEEYITGDAEPWDKFRKWAELLPRLMGNPLYHWSQLELKRYFGIEEPLTGKNAKAVWTECNEKLKTMSARQLVRDSRVKLLYTTNDPADSLEYHKLLKENFEIPVLPAFRPDRVLQVESPDFAGYITTLGEDIRDIDTLMAALIGRMDAFEALGCRNSDHSMGELPITFEGDPELTLRRALCGMEITPEDALCFRSYLMYFLAEEYARRGWVMQLHFGVQRDADPVAFRELGPNTGFDVIRGDEGSGRKLAAFLGRLSQDGILPKTVLYSMDPADNIRIGSVIGSFQAEGIRGSVQQGPAWWFNDNMDGILAQLKTLANGAILGNFIGMTTDSRSFLSFTRHEYFRRILCRLLGGWMKEGQVPENWDMVGSLVQDVCWKNAYRFFVE